jgi:hypothetical protein
MSLPGETHRCRSCGAAIIWLPTATGKNMPVNAGTWAQGDTTFSPGRHISHFATCPNADRHRKARP